MVFRKLINRAILESKNLVRISLQLSNGLLNRVSASQMI